MTSQAEVNRLNAIRHLRNAKEIELYDSKGLIVKAIKKIDSSVDKLRRVELAMQHPEINYPEFVPPLETCLYCGTKLVANTRLCPSCHNPI